MKGTPTGGLIATRAFWSGKLIVLLFAVLVYYSYLLSPDWMWMYFAKASDLPSWFTWYALILYFFAYAAGFFLKFELGKVSKGLPVLLLLAMLAASVGVTLPLKDRYMNVGTMEQYRAGQTTPLNQSPVGKVPGTLSAVLVPLAIGLLVWSRRQKVS